ncbi:hypothetical protein I4U23_015861 [Adineta vaga]|nr:hypothetical protein I4U23_015861 [Adineta vaga]
MSSISSLISSGSILNMISTGAESMTLLISMIFVLLIIYRFVQVKHRSRQIKIEVPIILSLNTLCLVIAKSVLQLIDVNLATLKRDFYLVIEQNQSFFCQFRAYVFFSIVSALYWSCALQAFFRFIRVVYPTYEWLYQPKIYFYVFIPGEIAVAFGMVLPHLLVFNGMQLIPNENYCTALMNEFISLMYLFFVVFGLPLSIIFICYICIIYKIRQASALLRYRQRNQRDYHVIRRIMMVVVILSIASLPAIIDLIIYVPKGQLDPLVYRIEWVSASVNALIFTISQPFISPKLYKLLKEDLMR